VNFDAYARTAVDLVNAVWTTSPGCGPVLRRPGLDARRDPEKDLAVFRRARRRLRDVFEYGTSGRDADAVNELNTLLEAFPVQPRISGHDASDWHMHVTSRGSSVSAEYLAGAVWGLSVWLCEYGSARFGICADERCGNVYLDTSSNNCRRFCSERCATRSHVAAHRARKRREPHARARVIIGVAGEAVGRARWRRANSSDSRRSASRAARLAARRVETSSATEPVKPRAGQRPQQLGARLVAPARHQVLVAALAGAVAQVHVLEAGAHPVGHRQRVDPRGRAVRQIEGVRVEADLGRIPARRVGHEPAAGHLHREHVFDRERDVRVLGLRLGQPATKLRA
jgi:predicted RNA-binding Zn ribbon-like protein